MRPLLLSLLLVPSLGSARERQDDAKVAEWIRDLGDDGIDVRDRARAELVRAGRPAEKALREAMKGLNEEARVQAAQVLAEIEKNERVRQFEPAPTRITLRKKDAPLKEVLEEIQKQTATKIAFSFAPEQAKVTVAFEGTLLFEAVEAICRAAGNLTYSVECRRDDTVTVTLSEGKLGDPPRAFRDQYFVRLEGMQLTTTYDLQGGEASRTRFDFRWGWEKGTRPQRAVLRIEEVQDDLGNSYAEEFPPDPGGRPFGFQYVQNQQALEFPKVPPERATRFARVKGALELVFPESLLVFRFEKPEEAAGAERKLEGGSIKLVTCARDKARLRAKIEVRPAELGGRLEMKATDKEGRDFAGRYTRGEQSTEEAILMSIEFTVPAQADLTAVRFQSPAGFREKRIPFDFKDVRFR